MAILDFFKKTIQKSHSTTFSGFGLGYSFGSYKDKKLVHSSYLQNDDVYSMISKGAKTIANNIKWKFYEVDKDGNKEEVFDNDYLELINNPNKYQTLTEFREQAYTFLMLTGRSFIGGLESMGFNTFSSLHNLPSQVVNIKLGDLSNPIIKYECDWNMQRIWLPENVLYTKYITVDENDYFNGLSPLRAGERLLESSNNLVTADAATLKNRGASGLLTNRSEDVMIEKEKLELEKALDLDLGGAEKFNRIIPTTANVDLIQFGMSPRDLEILKSDISKRRRFSNLWGFDSGEFNDPENKTYNSRKESAKAAFTNVYIPTDKKFIDGFNKWLSPRFKTKSGKKLIIEQDLTEIEPLQQDKHLVARVKQIRSTESRLILQDYNTGIILREAAFILLVGLGYTEDDAEILLKPQPTQNTNTDANK